MKSAVWLRLAIAAGLAFFFGAVLLTVSLAAPARPQSSITMGRAPSPPHSVSRGMTEIITWTVTTDINHPDKIVFKLFDPNNVLIETQEYPGSTGLSVTRAYTIPNNPMEGPYWARVYYYSLESGFEAEAAVKFLVAERGNLHIYKFNDINGDGTQQAGEGPLQGVLVRMRNPYGDISGQYTRTDGWIIWDGIAIGSYQVTETVPFGYRATLPVSQPAIVNIDATTYITFANQQLGNLRAFKYEDINGNGQRDAGEAPVSGIPVTVRYPSGATETQLTGVDGYASWTAIPVGTYRITETVPASWRATLPTSLTADVTFNATREVVFANQRLGNLRAFKYEDVNGNGLQDAGEGPAPGVTVTVRYPSGVTESQLTGTDGYAVWNAIPVGTYRITETVPASWRATLPTSLSADVNFNATRLVIFANQRLGNLRAFKYEDVNGNGQRDAGEAPVQGIPVTVRYPSGVTESLLTGVDGYASWTAIPVGTYRITETVPASWRATLPTSLTADVTFNATREVVFANQRLGNLRAFKYEDVNGNGQRDMGEGPVSGIPVTVRYPSGVTESQLTGADGYAVWTAIPVGTYRITETVPASWRATLPTSLTADVTFNATREVVFANQRLGNLRAFKYEDVNGNGQRDAGEAPVPGVTVTVRYPSGVTETQLTGADGYASWTAIPVGTYRITETVPASWRATLPTSLSVDVSFNATREVVFANQRLGHLRVFVFEDVDGDGQRDAGENPVPDITITERAPSGATETKLTGADGYTGWYSIPVGTYYVTETVPAGWRATLPTSVSANVNFNATTDVVFAIQRLGNLRVFKYKDADADGQRDAGEGPVSGIPITVRYPSSATETKLTGADGYAVWTAIPVGTYRVTETLPMGWRASLPAVVSVEVRFNTTTDVVFANRPPRFYLPLIYGPPPPPTPTPTPTATMTPTTTPTATPTMTPTATPTATPTMTPTASPTATPTPVPTRPPVDIPGLIHPKGIGVNLKTHHLFVASRDTHVVYQVDPSVAPAVVLRAIPVGREPFGVAVNNATGKVYVANFVGDSVTVLNAVTGAVIKTIPMPYGEPSYVAINETTNRIYVTLHEAGRLAVIRGDTDALVTTVEVGSGAFGVAADPGTNRVFVSCRDNLFVRTVDGNTNTVLWDQTVYTGGTPYALGIDPSLGRLYVAFAPELDNPRQVLVYRIVPEGLSLLSSVLVGNGGPNGGGGIGVNPLTHHVFVSNSAADTVSVFDGVTSMLLDTVPVGQDPLFVAVDPGWSYIWVGNRKSSALSGILDVYPAFAAE